MIDFYVRQILALKPRNPVAFVPMPVNEVLPESKVHGMLAPARCRVAQHNLHSSSWHPGRLHAIGQKAQHVKK